MCCMLSFGETSESEQLKKCFGSIGQMQTSGKETQRRVVSINMMRTAYVIPTDEICAALGIPVESVTKLKKACYGLVDAPLEWFLTVSEYLVSIGFTRCVTDPCCFKYVNSKGDLVGHDIMTCGRLLVLWLRRMCGVETTL